MKLKIRTGPIYRVKNLRHPRFFFFAFSCTAGSTSFTAAAAAAAAPSPRPPPTLTKPDRLSAVSLDGRAKLREADMRGTIVANDATEPFRFGTGSPAPAPPAPLRLTARSLFMLMPCHDLTDPDPDLTDEAAEDVFEDP